MPRVSRAYAAAVVRPFAEQLVKICAIVPGRRVLNIDGGDGELTRLLSRAVSPGGSVTAVTGDECRGDLRTELIASGCHAKVVVATADAIPFADGAFDAALSLFALDPADPLPAVLDELTRVASRAAVAIWDDAAEHVVAMRDAWLEAAGTIPPALAVTAAAESPPPGWRMRAVTDVARFDSIGQLCTALAGENEAPPPAALRDAMAARLRTVTAHDGTLRIPLRAILLER